MTLHLAAPEHAVRMRSTLPTLFLLMSGVGLVPIVVADEVVDVPTTSDEIDVDSIVDPIMPGPDAESPNPVEVLSPDDILALDEIDLEAEELPEPVELTPHSAEYRVKISVLSGRLNTSLVRTDTGYEANHRIRPTGLARMVSGGTIEEFSSFESTAHGIVPIHYVSNDSLTSDKTRADVDFDWETNTITGTVNDEPVEVVLEEFAHDRVSTQYQLMSDLMNGGVAERYVLYDIDEIKILNVTVIGEREIRVPAGEFTAIGVRHQAEGSSRTTTMWCVEELDYLPVMIEQHRRGELRMRAQLRSYSPIES